MYSATSPQSNNSNRRHSLARRHRNSKPKNDDQGSSPVPETQALTTASLRLQSRRSSTDLYGSPSSVAASPLKKEEFVKPEQVELDDDTSEELPSVEEPPPVVSNMVSDYLHRRASHPRVQHYHMKIRTALKQAAADPERLSIIVSGAAPLVLLLLFPLVLALRVIAIALVPLAAVGPVIVVAKRTPGRRQRIIYITLFAGAICLALIPYGFVVPVYFILEVFPVCLISVPVILACIPLTIVAMSASFLVWSLQGGGRC